MKTRSTIAALAVLAAGTSGVVAEELKFANFTPPFHTINESVIEKLNSELSAATDGELTVRGYHGGELGAGPAEQYVRAVQGVADITWGLPGYTSSQFGKTMIVELPNVIPLDQPGYPALSKVEEDLKGEFPGVKVLANWTSEPNIFIMKEKVVRSPDDLAGLKIRVAGSTMAEVATALGATPVQMPINQVYNALQTGLIDGVITGASTLSDFKLDEVSNSQTLGANIGRGSFFVVMNLAKYEGLPESHKAAIDSLAGVPLSKSAEEAWLKTADAAMNAARSSGENTVVDLTSADIQKFNELVNSVVDDYVSSVSGESVLSKMRAN